MEQVTDHGPDIGIIPASLHLSALDVDRGDIQPLIDAYPPLAVIPSPHGHHLYYGDTQPRGNKNWRAFGCGGEVRSGRGFLRLYDDGLVLLADGVLTEKKPAFPIDLVQWTVPAIPQERTQPAPIEGAGYLEQIQEGQRNEALFNGVRFWAYRQSRGRNSRTWARYVLAYALEQNQRFPDPLTDAEVGCLAESVSKWCWEKSGRVDQSTEAQRRRGVRSGESRRERTAERDAAIIAAVQSGKSKKAVARKYGLTPKAIRHILSRGGD